MAQKILTETVDDIDGTPDAESVSFSLNGTFYDIDLSPANIEKLDKALAPFIRHGRPNTHMRQMRVVPLDRNGKPLQHP